MGEISVKGAIGCTSLTGEDYSLDRVPSSLYGDGVVAIVPIKDDLVYFYIYDSTNQSPQSLPNVVIPRDNLSEVGAWERTSSDSVLKDVTAEGMFVRTLQGWVEIQEPEDGADGRDGTYWYSGSDVPSIDLGRTNDFYFDNAKYDLYKKSLPIYNDNNLFTGGTGSVDSVNGINAISRAFDTNLETHYQSTATHATLIYNFGEGVAHPVTKIRIYRRVHDIKNINIYGSIDGIEYDLLSSNVLSDGDTGWVDIEFFNVISYQFIKLDILNTYSTDDIIIAELEAYYSVNYDWDFICNVRGTKGSSGSAWIVGDHATPLLEEGRPGDFYLYETLFNVFRKDIATYELTPSLNIESEVDIICNNVTDCINIFDTVNTANETDIINSFIMLWYVDEIGKAITKVKINTTNVKRLFIEAGSGDGEWNVLHVGMPTVDGEQIYEFINTMNYAYYRFRVTEVTVPGTWYLNDLEGWESLDWAWRSLGTIKGNDGYGLMEGITTIAASSTIDFFDWQHKNIMITDNILLTLDFPRGGIYSLKIHQDAVGGRTFTFTNTIHWLGNIEPGWITDPNSYCIISFRYDGITIDAIGDIVFGEDGGGIVE